MKVFRVSLICLLVTLMVALFATPALAFDARGGQTVTVPSGEVVEGDLYVAGNNVVIDGTVNGDVFAAGQTLTINGKVNGGVSLAGQTITLNGSIGNGARVAGQSIIVNGNIGRDFVVFASDMTMSGKAAISGDLVMGLGTATINGRIAGNIRGNVGQATISGEVGGNVDLTSGSLIVASGARIQGGLTYTSENQAVIQSGASIAGTTAHKVPVKEPARTFWSSAVWQVLGFLMILVLGIIFVLIASRRVAALANSVQSRPWQTLGLGAVILIVTPIAAIIVMITVIGLPLGLISLVLYGIALYLSQVPIGLLIGRLIIRRKPELESRGMMIAALALGLFILFVLRLIPFVGWIVTLLTIVFGLGALITASRNPRSSLGGEG